MDSIQTSTIYTQCMPINNVSLDPVCSLIVNSGTKSKVLIRALELHYYCTRSNEESNIYIRG